MDFDNCTLVTGLNKSGTFWGNAPLMPGGGGVWPYRSTLLKVPLFWGDVVAPTLL